MPLSPPRQCPWCSADLTSAITELFHSGRSDLHCLYCEDCGRALRLSWYDRTYARLVRDNHRFPVTLMRVESRQLIEATLQHCPCGGRFTFTAVPRCPVCRGSLEHLLPDGEYCITGPESIDSEKSPESIWINPEPR